MSIRVQCPGCKTSYKVNDKLAGGKAKCAKCGTLILVPPPVEAKRQPPASRAGANPNPDFDLAELATMERAAAAEPVVPMPAAPRQNPKRSHPLSRSFPKLDFSQFEFPKLSRSTWICMFLLVIIAVVALVKAQGDPEFAKTAGMGFIIVAVMLLAVSGLCLLALALQNADGGWAALLLFAFALQGTAKLIGKEFMWITVPLYFLSFSAYALTRWKAYPRASPAFLVSVVIILIALMVKACTGEAS